MPRGARGIDAGIAVDRGGQAFVPQQLTHDFECAWLGVENDLGAQMPKLMRRQFKAEPLAQDFGDPHPKPLDLFGDAFGVDEQQLRTPAKDPRRDLVHILP